MAIITPKHVPFEYYVYALLCQDGDGPLYIKFGLSRSITKRMMQLRQGCPVPARYFAIYYVGSEKEYAEQVEAALRSRFANRKIRGEWFRFDAESKEDKRDFNDGCLEAFLACGYYGLQWEKIPVQAVVEYCQRQKNAFLARMKKHNLTKFNAYQKKKRMARKELSVPLR